jgi:hypothetical protein
LPGFNLSRPLKIAKNKHKIIKEKGLKFDWISALLYKAHIADISAACALFLFCFLGF